MCGLELECVKDLQCFFKISTRFVLKNRKLIGWRAVEHQCLSALARLLASATHRDDI